MAFVPRTYETIRDDALAYIVMQTNLTDTEVGSVTRTIVEAMALEDDEQYFQMVQLLDAFRLSTSSGDDLDDRVAEYGVIRLQPASAAGEVLIEDETLVTTLMTFDNALGVSSIIMDDVDAFPTAGFPITVRLGEGTIQVEDVSVTSISIPTLTATLAAPTTKAHNAGDRFSLVTAAADVDLSPGIRVQVPATTTEPARVAVTTESGTVVNGNFLSTRVRAKMEIPGSVGKIGALRITQFADSPPFDGAGVQNPTNFAGGRDKETDAELRDRGRAAIQALSKGTILALKEGVLGIEDPVTGQRVTTSNILESFVADEVIVYVDDGTGFTPDTVVLAQSVLFAGVGIGVGALVVTDASDFAEEGFLIASPSVAAAEILEYSGVDYGTNTISLVGVTANAHAIAAEVSQVDPLAESAEAGQNFFQTASFPIPRNSQRIWLDSGSGPALQEEGTDYFINRGTGEVEFTGAGVTAGSVVVTHYTFFTALISQVQKVIDGDPTDPINFPGIRAGGVRVLAETPIIRRITVRVAISARPGIQETDLVPQVQEVIEAYINGLGIGENVIRAEIVERAMSVDGMFDIHIALPTDNIVILENELPVPIDVLGNSLVTVS